MNNDEVSEMDCRDFSRINHAVTPANNLFDPPAAGLRYWTFPWFRIDDFESFARTMTLLKFPKKKTEIKEVAPQTKSRRP